MKHQVSDEELVEAVISGNKDAFADIMYRYETKLRRYIMRLINRSEEVDDIIQNVFIKTYMNLSAYRPALPFSSWIFRIAHNETVNVMKSSFIQKVVSLKDTFDIGFHPTVEDDIDRDQLKRKLASCMSKLDIKYKEPLVLHVMEDKSYEEISDILRVPVRTVGVLIYRGKLQIKKICNEKK